MAVSRCQSHGPKRRRTWSVTYRSRLARTKWQTVRNSSGEQTGVRGYRNGRRHASFFVPFENNIYAQHRISRPFTGRARDQSPSADVRTGYLPNARAVVYARLHVCKKQIKKKKRQKWGGKTTNNSNVTLVTRTRTDKPRRPCERHYNFNRLRRTHFIRNNIYFVP